jgi:hypothetical protein
MTIVLLSRCGFLGSSMPESGLQEPADQRVGHRFAGLGLRYEQSSYEEWVLADFDYSNFSMEVSAGNDQVPAASQRVRILRINAESTVVTLNDIVFAVKVAGRGSRLESNRQLHSRDGTAQGSDEKPGSRRAIFGVMSVGKPEYIAGELQDHVLKTAAGSQAGH